MRFHTCSPERRGRGAAEEAYLHSLRVFGFLEKKKLDILQGMLQTNVGFPQPEAGEKSTQPTGVGNAHQFLQEVLVPVYSACDHLTTRRSSAGLEARWSSCAILKLCSGSYGVYNPHAENQKIKHLENTEVSI